jgi:hypothetical protein
MADAVLAGRKAIVAKNEGKEAAAKTGAAPKADAVPDKDAEETAV